MKNKFNRVIFCEAELVTKFNDIAIVLKGLLFLTKLQ